MSYHNQVLVRRFLDALWNRQDFAFVDDLLASDYDGRSSTEFDGPEGAKQLIPTLRRAFPALEFKVLDQIAEGDRVATRWMMCGTEQGDFSGIRASGKCMTMTDIMIFRLAGDKLIEGWTNEDQMGVLQQLGAFPVPEHM